MPPAKKIGSGPTDPYSTPGKISSSMPAGRLGKLAHGVKADALSAVPGAARMTPRSGMAQPTGYSSKERPMKPMKLGGGGRFEAFVQRVVSEGKSESQAKAIAAAAGRRKYGAAKMGAMAAKGRKS